MYQVTRYRCSLCHGEYQQPATAERCEALGKSDPKFKIGDKIDYGTEDGLGSRWAYCSASGTVIGRRLILAVGEDNQKRHIWMYAVKEDGVMGEILGTVGVAEDPEGRLQSYAEMRRITVGPEFETAA